MYTYHGRTKLLAILSNPSYPQLNFTYWIPRFLYQFLPFTAGLPYILSMKIGLEGLSHAWENARNYISDTLFYLLLTNNSRPVVYHNPLLLAMLCPPQSCRMKTQHGKSSMQLRLSARMPWPSVHSSHSFFLCSLQFSMIGLPGPLVLPLQLHTPSHSLSRGLPFHSSATTCLSH